MTSSRSAGVRIVAGFGLVSCLWGCYVTVGDLAPGTTSSGAGTGGSGPGSTGTTSSAGSGEAGGGGAGSAVAAGGEGAAGGAGGTGGAPAEGPRLDETFGRGGVATPDLGGPRGSLSVVRLQSLPSGRIAVAGHHDFLFPEAYDTGDAFVAFLTPEGELDPSFAPAFDGAEGFQSGRGVLTIDRGISSDWLSGIHVDEAHGDIYVRTRHFDRESATSIQRLWIAQVLPSGSTLTPAGNGGSSDVVFSFIFPSSAGGRLHRVITPTIVLNRLFVGDVKPGTRESFVNITIPIEVSDWIPVVAAARDGYVYVVGGTSVLRLIEGTEQTEGGEGVFVDSSFGGGDAFVTVDPGELGLGTSPSPFAIGLDLARNLYVGFTSDSTVPRASAIVKFRPDGSGLDLSFGTSGVLPWAIAAGRARPGGPRRLQWTFVRAGDPGPPHDHRRMNEHPWKRETRDLGPPVAWRFSFELGASPEELWPILIDTDRLDRAMKLPPIEYTEQDGALRGASRLFGVAFRWTERPWAWVAEKEMKALRAYDNGIATHLVVAFSLEPRSAGGTRVEVHLEWYPRSALSRPLFALGERHVRAAYQRALQRLDQQIAEDRPRHVLLARCPPALGREVQLRLAAIREELLQGGVKGALAEALLRHVAGADDMELRRVRLVPLARRWRVDERELVIACLYATRAGLLRLSWDVICPHCRGVRRTVSVLGEVPPKASCAPCAAEFSTDAPEAIEVTFQVDPSVRQVDTRVHCLAEAATKAHIKVQQPLDPGDRRSIETRLAPGRYRVRIVGDPRYRFLDVDDVNDVNDVNDVSDFNDLSSRSTVQEVTLRAGDRAALRSGPSPVLTLVNDGPERRTFVVEDVGWADDALRPAALFNLQEFRDLFAFEFLAAKVQIQVGEQTILFSDIVGSTRFYERLGDAVAFAAVKRHFHEVYTAVRANRGVVVKTIGDAVMAAFRDPGDALQAAIALQEQFDEDRSETGLRLRLTLTKGSCLAVNLNSGIDYFGRTVNLAAKLQGHTSAGQIVFPASLRDDPRAQRVLGAQKIPVQELTLDLPFLDEPLEVCRLDLHRREVAPPIRMRPARHRRAGIH
ncbi:uncharacterized protein SOCE26_018020 [Sorangium cellulosum]|uniref:Guanylate cyclase domain-containing protein n=1 Tax=Sorangium cellulosum TaxID=56 RepID=A0A2L0EM78_SORCE|nr:DUF5939 domain-containing protein [Sorangium cellulosum]AUX40401.1 uncharacterized protein SOCE26_018020 [Sorangium cellulosum]